VRATLIKSEQKAEVENFVLPLRTIGMRKMCQSLQFVVTPEKKNLFSKNDKMSQSLNSLSHKRAQSKNNSDWLAAGSRGIIVFCPVIYH